MGQEDVLRSLLHIIPFLAAISPGLCLRPGQVRKGGRERRGAGAVHKMAGLHLGLPDIH